MRCKKCKKPVIIKNKFKSTIVGSLGIYFGFGYVLPMSYLSVYITSFIHIKQNFVNMHYGYFLNLILTLAMTFSVSFGGLLENKLGYTFTTLLGTIIIFISNFFFFKIQNIIKNTYISLFLCLDIFKYMDLLFSYTFIGRRCRNYYIIIRKKFNLILP